MILTTSKPSLIDWAIFMLHIKINRVITNLYLPRKKTKIEGFIKEDKNVTISRNARVL